MNDDLKLKGSIHAVLTDSYGNVKQEFTKDNLVVSVGTAYVASAILSTPSSPFTHMAIGTSGTVPTPADTTLGTETVRQVFSSSSVAANIVTMSTSYLPGVGTGSIQEAGLFNAASAGTMLSHVVFSAIGKASADTLTITWTITVG